MSEKTFILKQIEAQGLIKRLMGFRNKYLNEYVLKLISQVKNDFEV